MAAVQNVLGSHGDDESIFSRVLSVRNNRFAVHDSFVTSVRFPQLRTPLVN